MLRVIFITLILAAPAFAQTDAEIIDKLADQYGDFAPAVEEKPLEELLPETDVPDGETEVRSPDANTVADKLSAETAPPQLAQNTPADPGPAEIPEGWDRHAAFGLIFAVPPDWEVFRESERAYVLAAPGTVPQEKKGLALGVQLLDADDYRKQFLENETFSGLLDADTRPALAIGPDIAFERFAARPDDTGKPWGTDGAISPYRNDEYGHHLISFFAFDPALLDEEAALVDRIYATVRLSGPTGFKANAELVTSRASGASGMAEPVTTLSGLVTIRPPEGWELDLREDEVTLKTSKAYSAYVILRRGEAALAELGGRGEPTQGALGVNSRFERPPDVSDTEILGQRARVYSGALPFKSMQVGTRHPLRGQVREYVLAQCLPDASPIMIEMAAPDAWLEKNDLVAMLDHVAPQWPEGMQPCHPAIDARAEFAFDNMFAFVPMEGFETGRSRSSFWIRTKTDPYAAVSVGTGSDSFPAAFQLAASNSLGNGFIAAPEMRPVTIMGEPATLFVGRSQAGEGSRVQHVALLDRCLPDGAPVVVKLRADDAWLSANEGFEVLLNNVWIFLPEGTKPCDPALLQTAVEVSGAATAESIEPAEGGARGVTAGTDSTLPEPSGEGTDRLAGAVSPVLDGDMSNWSVTAAEFDASAAEITAKPGGDGGTSYYVAPALAMGDWSHVRALRLDKKSHGGRYYADGYGSEGDIVLEGPAGRAAYPLPEHHSGEWRSFEIPLNDPGWSLSQGAASLADVLSSVTALRIRAEYGAGPDYSGLRNMSLVVSNQEAPSLLLASLPPGGQETLPPAKSSATDDQVEETLQALAERGMLTVRALIAYDRLPASLRGELLQLRSQGVDILGQDATGLQRLLEESRDRLTPQQRAAMGRLLDALQAVTASPSAPVAPEKAEATVLFDGNGFDGWETFGFNGGSFDSDARLVEGALRVDIPDGKGWAKTGLRSQKAVITMPARGSDRARAVSLRIDAARSNTVTLAFSPPEAAAADPYRTSDLRLQIRHKKAGLGELKASKLGRGLGFGVDFPWWPTGEAELNVILRPNQVVELRDGDGDQLAWLPIAAEYGGREWVLQVYAQVPSKNDAALLDLHRVELRDWPHEVATDYSLLTGEPRTARLFDGRSLAPRWSPTWNTGAFRDVARQDTISLRNEEIGEKGHFSRWP